MAGRLPSRSDAGREFAAVAAGMTDPAASRIATAESDKPTSPTLEPKTKEGDAAPESPEIPLSLKVGPSGETSDAKTKAEDSRASKDSKTETSAPKIEDGGESVPTAELGVEAFSALSKASAAAVPTFSVSVTGSSSPVTTSSTSPTSTPNDVAAIHDQEEMLELLKVGLDVSSAPEPTPEAMIEHLGGQLYQLNGATELSIDAEYFGGEAGYRNSIGYYFSDSEGTPLDGHVMWSNVKKGGEQSYDLTASDIPENAEYLGFFIIPNGASRNRDLENGEDITFTQDEDGTWHAVDSDGDFLKGHGKHGPVFFSDAKLNPDYHTEGDSARGVHVLDHPDVIGNANWEDLLQKSWEGYGDYDDVNMQIDVTGSASGPLESIVVSETDISGDSVNGNVFNVGLAPGDPVELTFTVKAEAATDVDMYLLQDVSSSFGDDLVVMRAMADSLTSALVETYGESTRFGMGSFADKPFGGYGDIADYAYRHDLSLTDDAAAFKTALKDLDLKYGVDTPESQFEALYQTAIRADTEIGFRDASSRFVVMMTDAVAHEPNPPAHVKALFAKMGFDYTYSLPENDGDTDLEYENYPDFGMLKDALIEAGITPIFAVAAQIKSHDHMIKELLVDAGLLHPSVLDAYPEPYMVEYNANLKAYYETVVDRLGFGSVVDLQSDSSDVIEAIKAGVSEATTNIKAFVTEDSPYLDSISTDHTGPVAPGEEITYTVRLDADSLKDGLETDVVRIDIPGFGDVEINISMLSHDSEREALVGTDAAEVLDGGDETDMLNGAGGDDVLEGKGGDDFLTGGAGEDRFVFTDGAGHDVITDFTQGLDLLDLRMMSAVKKFSDVQDAMASDENGVTLTFGDTSISLLGVKDLTEEDLLL